MMKYVRAIVRALLGLIIDDWRLALITVAWLAVVWLALPALGLAGTARCVVLFAGLALILAESSWRQARTELRHAAKR